MGDKETDEAPTRKSKSRLQGPNRKRETRVLNSVARLDQQRLSERAKDCTGSRRRSKPDGSANVQPTFRFYARARPANRLPPISRSRTRRIRCCHECSALRSGLRFRLRPTRTFPDHPLLLQTCAAARRPLPCPQTFRPHPHPPPLQLAPHPAAHPI